MEKVLADGHVGQVALAYAVESHPYYRLMKDHRGRVFRIVLADGEEAVVRLAYVDEEHEDFTFDLLSTTLDRKYRDMPKEAAYAVKFTELVSARLEE